MKETLLKYCCAARKAAKAALGKLMVFARKAGGKLLAFSREAGGKLLTFCRETGGKLLARARLVGGKLSARAHAAGGKIKEKLPAALKKHLRVWHVAALCMALAFTLGISLTALDNAAPLPEGMASETLVNKSRETLDILHQKNYVALSDRFKGGVITAEEWESALGPVLDAMGPFTAYGDIETVGTWEAGTQYGVALVECRYEFGRRVYSVSYSADWQLRGLRVVG